MRDADAAMRASRTVSEGAADMVAVEKENLSATWWRKMISLDVRSKGKNLKPKEWENRKVAESRF